MRHLIAIAVVGLVLGAAGSARAQGKAGAKAKAAAPAAAAAAPAADAQAADSAEPKYKVERGAGGRKVIRLTDALVIQGKIQKPEAFFFYQKSNIDYTWQEMKQDFVPKILDSVSKSPF